MGCLLSEPHCCTLFYPRSTSIGEIQMPRTPAFRVALVISCLVTLIAFPFVFVIVSFHWLVVVYY
jgi:hypothetical protein